MRWRRLSALLPLVLVALTLLACASRTLDPPTPVPTPTVAPQPTPTTQPPPKPTAAPPALSPPSSELVPIGAAAARPTRAVRVGHRRALADSALSIAAARGYFTQRKLQTSFQRYDSASALLEALQDNQLDAACLPVSAELFNSLAERGGLKLVAEAAGAPPGHGAAGLLLRPGLAARLETPTDLRGLQLAVPTTGDVLEVQLAALLEQGWLARTDVDLNVLATDEIALALGEARLDGAVLPEPLLTDLQRRGLGQIWRRSDQMLPNHQTDALVLSEQFAQRHPEAARQFVTAFLKAARLYDDVFVHRRSSVRADLAGLLARETILDSPTVVERIVLPGINPNGMVNMQTLRLDQEHHLATGQQRQHLELASYVDLQYAAYAITQLGEYR